MDKKQYDFSGWATKNNLLCSDGRIIRKDAFKENDGQVVPLVWNHTHNDPDRVLGHALLENRDEGVYAYCSFNDTENGKNTKLLVEHGDVCALSIYANRLKQQGANVMHGSIREVSIVLAGANPGAFIDNIVSHGEESEGEAIIFTGEEIELHHSDDSNKNEEKKGDSSMSESTTQTKKEKTLQDVIDTMTEEQKTALYALVGLALEQKDSDENNDDEGDNNVKHNVFSDSNDEYNASRTTLSHSEMQEILSDGKRYGSLKDAFIQHGIEDIEYLFPDAKNMTNTPIFIDRNQEWVKKVMNSVHHTPFSRIKSIFANITEEDARAKGYIKGNLKKDEVFGLLKRTTTPITVYKKQKLDRDDVVDITDFDVVAWIKTEMRSKLDEELARAFLVGDGRTTSSDDKINEANIRPIWTDADLFTIKTAVTVSSDASSSDRVKAFIRACVKSRKNYKGSGNPDLYTTEDVLIDCLLLEDNDGRVIYDSEEKLKKALRVNNIITVPVMEDLTRTDSDGKTRTLMGIVVNLADYNVGADKGGAVNMFDDFDIDYNAQKYLIETRCSGALTVPYSAIALELVETSSSATSADTEEETA
ncbi:MAG: HK97 family phage prohead protease [Clostridia bacterium]|nr:HK97 family phage prohead protease [Clostridia bacterium]